MRAPYSLDGFPFIGAGAKTRLAYEVAEAELRSAAGTQLDPELVEALLRVVATEAPQPQPHPELSPDATGAPQPRPEFGFAHQAC